MMNSNVKWIWTQRGSYNTYNDTIVAVRRFQAGEVTAARIQITADSRYRLFVNGHWIADGPARAWSERYCYDVHEIEEFLRPGENEIKIVARYFGCGTFHGVPQQAGLAAQVDLRTTDGRELRVATDSSWQVADGVMWRRNTPKVSIQMEPAELYDATLEDQLVFEDAVELFPVGEGPWKNLSRREVACLTRRDFSFKAFAGASLVASPSRSFCMAHTRVMNPGLIEANGRVFSPFGIATILVLESDGEVVFEKKRVDRGFLKIAVDGQVVEEGERISLNRGRHLVLGFARNILNNDKTVAFGLSGPDDLVLRNPLDGMYANPWCYLPMRDYAFVQDDMVWRWFAEPLSEGRDVAYEKLTDSWLSEIRQVDDFISCLGSAAENIPSGEMFVEDSYLDFCSRREIGNINELVQFPNALLSDDESWTEVPACEGDVELVYDLGEENCGYIDFDLVAEHGVVVDLFMVEYIHSNGAIQFSEKNRNGFRYITRQGTNCYTSMKRRAGRYLFITLRNLSQPVRLRNVKLIESTYPVDDAGLFSCSNPQLNAVAELSVRTLKLCMEDVYTDCPLYEQTLWVGDLRNEALYGYYAFGATDIAWNSLRLAAESVSRYGMVGSQVPSCWDMVLPAWSFLWGIAVWEYFWYTGDQAGLEALYPAVVKNIQSAEKRMSDQGLFSAEYWNFFDWAKIDKEHRTVFHNNMLFVGALQAAVSCAEAMRDEEGVSRFSELAQALTGSINRFWNAEKKSYPDSLHDDGLASGSSSQHTAFLSLLYDIVEPVHVDEVVNNMLNPSEETIEAGSPFATMYMYEALEKTGFSERVIDLIGQAYRPMLEIGASTAWESYAQGTLAQDGFPTRSHCHGWSASPIYFFQRIILGVRQTGVGGSSFEISPRFCGLSEAEGVVKTVRGDLRVAWRREESKCFISYEAPPDMEVSFRENESLYGVSIELNSMGMNETEKGRLYEFGR
ncbi:alpha-L-rhamnosidase-related protein [Tichowtungia aerotolerans]|uniref:Alpha-L-rhamnosidase n=1 Tax=Tichowtungia aerotolerans TaxID=2697043 RepID=A0A6P1M3J2_9BACT|nr:alpha-L-rhamnosidase N-terminal domain-containing protein [Tichowtungia aerotolerans]QHI68391.1 hypothetical protein GT409_02605 [Tichowtungia aerotolerans]